MYYLKYFCIWSCIIGLQFAKSELDVMGHPNWELLDKENCGLSNSDRIVGGKNASLGAYPWIVQVGYLLESKAKVLFKCGGSLINERYVVTAAHCVANLPSKLKVAVIRVGEHNTRTNPDCVEDYCAEPVQDIEPDEIIFHGKYNSTFVRNDIAIIRLKEPAIFNENVKPICLVRDEMLTKNLIGEISEVAGWGIFDIKNSKSSAILQTIKMPIVELENCQKLYKTSVELGPGQLCVGGKIGHDSCAGDSGGPLMKVEALDGPPKYYLIGIVSFGVKNCGESETPAVYTQISFYIQWILNHLKP